MYFHSETQIFWCFAKNLRFYEKSLCNGGLILIRRNGNSDESATPVSSSSNFLILVRMRVLFFISIWLPSSLECLQWNPHFWEIHERLEVLWKILMWRWVDTNYPKRKSRWIRNANGLIVKLFYPRIYYIYDTEIKKMKFSSPESRIFMVGFNFWNSPESYEIVWKLLMGRCVGGSSKPEILLSQQR